MMNKILPALGTILMVVIALVVANEVSRYIQRMRDKKAAEQNAAAEIAAAAQANANMRVAA